MRRTFAFGFGIWVLGFGIFLHAQGAGGSLGRVEALGQEVKAPPVRNEPPPRLPDGTVSFDGLWVGGGPINDIAQGLPKGEKLPLTPEGVKLMAYRAQHGDALEDVLREDGPIRRLLRGNRHRIHDRDRRCQERPSHFLNGFSWPPAWPY